MVLILCGKSGSGKDAVLKELEKSGKFTPIVSDTTRPMREGEVDGVSYNFLSKEEFLNKLNNDGYIEHREYHTTVGGKPDTWYYGCPKDDYVNGEKDFVVIFDIEGTKEFAKQVGVENVIVTELVVDDRTREERAKLRGGFDQTEWDRRLADDNVKFDFTETFNVVDFTIYNFNQSLEQTVQAVVDNYKNFAQMRNGAHQKEAQRLRSDNELDR